MSEPITQFITEKLDGNQKASVVSHYRRQFAEFVKQPKYKAIYETLGGWKQLLRPVVKVGSTASELLDFEGLTEEAFWSSLVVMETESHSSVVSDLFLEIVQDSHKALTPLAHVNLFKEKMSLIQQKFLDYTAFDLSNWVPRDLNPELEDYREKAEEARIGKIMNIQNTITGVMAQEFLHALGGSEILTQEWNKTQTMSLQEANDFEIARWLQTYCTRKGVDMYIPRQTGDKKNTVPKTIVVEKEERENESKKKIQPPKGKYEKYPYNNNSNSNKRKVDDYKPQSQYQEDTSKKKKVVKVPCKKCIEQGRESASVTHEVKDHKDFLPYAEYKAKKAEEKEKEKARNQKK